MPRAESKMTQDNVHVHRRHTVLQDESRYMINAFPDKCPLALRSGKRPVFPTDPLPKPELATAGFGAGNGCSGSPHQHA